MRGPQSKPGLQVDDVCKLKRFDGGAAETRKSDARESTSFEESSAFFSTCSKRRVSHSPAVIVLVRG